MKVNDVIARAQQLKPDVYTEDQMTAWLSDLDGRRAAGTDYIHAGTDCYAGGCSKGD